MVARWVRPVTPPVSHVRAARAPGKAIKSGSSAWAPVAHMGNLDGVSRLSPGLAQPSLLQAICEKISLPFLLSIDITLLSK